MQGYLELETPSLIYFHGFV